MGVIFGCIKTYGCEAGSRSSDVRKISPAPHREQAVASP